MVIAPCTAASLGKMANGVADNVLITTYLSMKAPVFIAPAMDLDMYKHPSTLKNIDTLRSFGNHIIEPGSGYLASGLEGKGRMEEPENIVKTLADFFSTLSESQFYTEDLNSFIISEFIEKFYRYIIDSINTIDLPSSFFIDENFYNRNNGNLITLSSLYNREITFDFLNDNSTDINNKLKEYTNSTRDTNLKDTRINFIVNSSLNSFVDLTSLLPSDRIISYEPISISINNCKNYKDIPICPLEISDKYQVRYTERINSVIGSVNRYYNKDKDVIKRVSLVNGYSKYKYMISLKLSDIEEYLNIDCKYELKEIIDIYPLKGGLTELLTYLVLVKEGINSEIDYNNSFEVTWTYKNGDSQSAKLPFVIFKNLKNNNFESDRDE